MICYVFIMLRIYTMTSILKNWGMEENLEIFWSIRDDWPHFVGVELQEAPELLRETTVTGEQGHAGKENLIQHVQEAIIGHVILRGDAPSLSLKDPHQTIFIMCYFILQGFSSLSPLSLSLSLSQRKILSVYKTVLRLAHNCTLVMKHFPSRMILTRSTGSHEVYGPM